MIKTNKKYNDAALWYFECSSFVCIGGLIFYTTTPLNTTLAVANYNLNYPEYVHVMDGYKFWEKIEITSISKKDDIYLISTSINITLKCTISTIMESHFNDNHNINKYKFMKLHPNPQARRCERVPLGWFDVPISKNYKRTIMFLILWCQYNDFVILPTDIINKIIKDMVNIYKFDPDNYIVAPLMDGL